MDKTFIKLDVPNKNSVYVNIAHIVSVEQTESKETTTITLSTGKTLEHRDRFVEFRSQFDKLLLK